MEATNQGINSRRTDCRPREIGDIDHAGMSATCQHYEALVGIEDQRRILGQIVLFHAGWCLYLDAFAPIPLGYFLGTGPVSQTPG
jgi:hypothetical protein